MSQTYWWFNFSVATSDPWTLYWHTHPFSFLMVSIKHEAYWCFVLSHLLELMIVYIVSVSNYFPATLRDFLFHLNPGVSGPDDEVFFFNRDEQYALGVSWYQSQMPRVRPGVLTLLKTPNYFSQADPHRVYAMDPNIKLILVVCPPVRRAISSFVHNQVKSLFGNGC